ncbi:pentapeptide repeat-containing protein [Sphingopyxis sp. JAI128]|uniref:pentapeptide repeat-containing protein n=1 Tax=Sphingopyxis sp. JAI128 TaxID=2723066 RepID=UPI00160F8F82|nr:pentapeptide repeat-containing protein [Sphingopyxis sp. JAI128]MBB6426083.1 hypothetical protein [Sphingopyxis sp. JAI128]
MSAKQENGTGDGAAAEASPVDMPNQVSIVPDSKDAPKRGALVVPPKSTDMGPERSDLPGTPIVRPQMARTTHTKMVLKNRRFDDLNANKATFVDCDFSYCVFERAYLRSGTFRNCNFVGCQFYDSNLRGASFYSCDFRFATFHRTLLEPKEILANLPLEPNLRRDSLQNLRSNAVEIGDYKSQRLYVLSEIEARADHLTRAFSGSESYYREKYGTVLDKLRAGVELGTLRLGGAIWGHGEKPLLIAVSATVLILAMTLFNFWSVIPRVGWEETGSGLQILRYSIDQFLDAQPNPNFRGFLIVDYCLIAMRYLYIGLFISVLLKWLSHR